MAGLRFLGRTAPRHPGGGSGSASPATPSLGAGRGFETRVAPILDYKGHIAIVGRTGCGKTTLAKILAASHPYPVIVDWDGEYVDLGIPKEEPPFLLPTVDIKSLLSNLERPREGGHGIAAALQVAAELDLTNGEARPATLEELFKLLRSYVLQGAPQWAHAALARLAVLRKYCVLGVGVSPDGPLVYDLSGINVRERAIVQQAIATAVVFSRPLNPSDEILLLIEEGAMGATAEYLKDLIALARRRGVKIVYISQMLPPEELLNSFTLLIGDPGPLRAEWVRQLGVPLPRLRRGEFLAYDGNTVRKLRVKP